MSVRDLIPWGRQEGRAPSSYRESEPSPFLTLRREMDRLFDDFFHSPLDRLPVRTRIWPRIETKESEKAITVTAELPGLSETDVELMVEDGVLIIRGEQRNDREEPGYSERFYGRFERRIALPTGIDEEGCEAVFRDGLLTVTLPRNAQAERGRRIPVNGQTRH